MGAEFVQIIVFQVTISTSIREDSMCPLQKLFRWSFVMTLKPLYATRRPKEKKKHIPLFRQNKLHGFHGTTRWQRAPATALSFMRQVPHLFPPNSGVFKKRFAGCWLWVRTEDCHLWVFSFVTVFLHRQKKNVAICGIGKKRKKKNTKWNTRPGMILFICAGISMNSISGLSDSMAPKLWLSLRCSFVGFNRSVCQSGVVKCRPSSCQLPTDICPISVTS